MNALPLSEPSSSAPASSANDAKHEALRKAGAEYFERVLEEARRGRNVLNEAPRGKKPPKDVEAQDEDLETVGRLLPYVYGLLFFAAHASRLVLARRALQPLQTPAIQCFLHLLPSVCALAALVDVGPLTGRTLRGSAVQVAIFGSQTLSLFGALQYSGLYLVLAWTTLSPAVLAYNRSMAKHPEGTGLLNALLVALGVSGAAISLLARRWPSFIGCLCLLGWTAGEVGRLAWEQFRLNLQPEEVATDGSWRAWLSETATEEVKVSHPSMTFYQSALSAVPALLIGFVCQEGSELVDHELSVPAVSGMLLSCGAWTAATVSGVLLVRAGPKDALRRLAAFTAVPALLLEVVLNGLGHRAEFCGAMLAVLGGAGAQQYW